MKKILFINIIFFFVVFNKALTDPIKVLNIDVSMDIYTAKSVLGNQYDCKINKFENNLGSEGRSLLCSTNDNYLVVSYEKNINNRNKGKITFFCKVYNGCDYNLVEVATFFQNTLNLKLHPVQSFGMFNQPAYCGEGPDGDKICVVKRYKKSLGPIIVLLEHKFGGAGMKIN